jgi:hypothetical protein
MVGNLGYAFTILVPVSPQGPKMRILDIEIAKPRLFPYRTETISSSVKQSCLGAVQVKEMN